MKRTANEDRIGIRRGGKAIGAAIFLVSFLPTAVPADQSTPDDSTETHASPVALNQAVSLDENLSVEQNAGPASPDESVQKSKAPIHQTSLRPRTIKRPSARDDKGERAATSTESVSWYRTGYGALAIVLCVVGLATWAARRWMPAIRISQSDVLQVVARANVTPKHSVALVQVGRRFVMVGVGGDRLSALCEVSDPDEVAELLGRVGASHAPPVEKGFEKMLLSETGEYKTAVNAEDEEASPPNGRDLRGGSAAGDLLRKLRAMQIES